MKVIQLELKQATNFFGVVITMKTNGNGVIGLMENGTIHLWVTTEPLGSLLLALLVRNTRINALKVLASVRLWTFHIWRS